MLFCLWLFVVLDLCDCTVDLLVCWFSVVARLVVVLCFGGFGFGLSAFTGVSLIVLVFCGFGIEVFIVWLWFVYCVLLIAFELLAGCLLGLVGLFLGMLLAMFVYLVVAVC